MKRKGFRIHGSWVRIDGSLRINKDGKPGETRAIVEVKPFVRKTNWSHIQMQEAAQMAAWIYNEPPLVYEVDGAAE
jgi:hypothetical protein